MKRLTLTALAILVAAPSAMPAPAFAQDRDYRDSRRSDRDYRDSRRSDRDYRSDREYRGRDRNYYQRCKKSSGTTGTVAGGVGGAVLGNVLGGGTLGTLAGAGGGALLGRHLDKKHDAAQNRKNGC